MLVALVLALAAPAPGLSLDWQAPAGCPDQALVRGRVAGMLGTGAFAAADLTATGRVSAAGEGWRLELSLVRAGGREERTLVDSDCAALADAAALMIAPVLLHIPVVRVFRTGQVEPGRRTRRRNKLE